MATRTVKPERHDRDQHGKDVKHQPRPFVGIGLAPLIGLLLSWLINGWVRGLEFDIWAWHVDTPGNLAALVVVSCLLTCAAIGLSYAAWHFAEHRKKPLRYALTGTTAVVAALFAISVGVGPDWWWSGSFVLTGWVAAALWAIPRLNVTRQDPREDKGDEDNLLEEWGIGKLRPKVLEQITDDKGRAVRTTVEVTARRGETLKSLQEAVPNLESAAAAPAGLSRATKTDQANKFTLVLQHIDPLEGPLTYGPPSHPGGSIVDPVNFALYSTGDPQWVYLAGGPRALNPSNYGFMGLSRTGKTLAENEMFTEIITRSDVVILYLNMAKGRQDIRPVVAGIEVAVLAEDMSAYKLAMAKVKAIMQYRQRQLAEYGISAWDAQRCYHNPPKRKANGEPVPMEPMPGLVVHMGEADAILDNGRTSEDAVYIASKCLSLGIITGLSLQRMSAEHAPTSLRYNIATWWCFGTGDEVSATFALQDSVIKAGAAPHEWSARRPGYHYFVGNGIDEALFPVYAKTYSGTDDRSFIQERMLERTKMFGPRMARLDRGSAMATGTPGDRQNWWDLMVAETDRIRASLIGGPANMSPADRGPTPQTTPQNYPANMTPQNGFAGGFAASDPADGETQEDVEIAAEIAAEVRETTHVEGIELYPEDEDGERANPIGVGDIMPPPPADDLSFADERPEAPDRESAQRAFHRALVELSDVVELRDPADPTGNTVIVTAAEISDRYPFRTRTWFISELSELAEGKRTPPPHRSLERAPDLGVRAGKYRLRRLPDTDGE